MKTLKVLLPVALLSVAGLAQAATSDGKTFAVSAGWLHVMPQGSAQGVYGETHSPLPVSYPSAPSAGFEVQDADTGGVMLDYFVNDNVSLELVLGAPPKMELAGKGHITALGQDVLNLNNFGKAATTDAYTPTFTGRYHFGSINNKFRPYVGAGIMYAHFSDVKTDGALNTALENSVLGSQGLGLKPTLGKVKVDDAVAPVVTLGADYNITKDWFATASVSYAHLSTNAKINVNSGLTNTTILSGQSEIEINPIVTYLGLGYRF